MKKTLKLILLKIRNPQSAISINSNVSLNTKIGKRVKILKGSNIGDCSISNYTYVGKNCSFERTIIGSFCSIGPEVICGMGSHPDNYVSTYPGFYSNNASGSFFFGNSINEVVEFKKTIIGNDVWIGARAIILGGVKIGNGAIIGAGAIVTKDVPPYGVVVGVPAKVKKYRFDKNTIDLLNESKWWDKDEETIKKSAKYINNINSFLEKINKHD
ncbi:CatB-related O-acetyltransferase [Flammeovirga sp. SJP92]|uniref:CatB-related O-acetyltransferase n=1 Tax=Flammeovirga sp. SJP92 TaxID=1775430 RepID=UPI000786B2D8|nr:CatB-related O-acetyltransferase [Flammeovirga sp. SJP92]KXX72549.1 acetyltransferase [Flammeovirga sp. SJP92]